MGYVLQLSASKLTSKKIVGSQAVIPSVIQYLMSTRWTTINAIG